ncbi:hypothetical protein [Thaumasiovibrio subtropicus]|uniref:hypothetical protein n=1 Tax=Thaumasiovibrio subtropicus TaxID=1891207 RepID=UPI000B35B64A|nr:hypothetical protein [Thaumasiovibrio subtropicus]
MIFIIQLFKKRGFGGAFCRSNFWVVAAFLVLLNGCAHVNKPTAGVEKRYWIYIDTHELYDGETYAEQYVTALLNYKVIDVDESVKLHIYAEHFEFDVDGKGYNSLKYRRQEEFKTLMTQGFDVDFNPTDGSILAIHGRATELWDELLDSPMQKLLDMLTAPLVYPALPESLPVISQQDALAATLFGHNVAISVQANDAKYVSGLAKGKGVVGQVTTRHDSTWIEQLSLIVEESDASDSLTCTIHTYVIRPANLPAVLMDNRWILRYQETINWFDIRPIAQAIMDAEEKADSSILKREIGEIHFDDRDGELTLAYQHNLESLQSLSLALRDIELVTENNEAVNLTALAGIDQHFTSADTSYFPVRVYGWSSRPFDRQISNISATLDYFPSELTQTSFQWQPDVVEQHIDVAGLNLKIVATERKGEYLLTYSPASGKWVEPYFEGLNGQYSFVIGTYDIDGLTHEQSVQLSKLNQDGLQIASEPVRFGYLFKLSEVPEQVSLLIRERATQPKTSNKVTFNRMD